MAASNVSLERRSRVLRGALERQSKVRYHLIGPQLWHLFSFSFSILSFPLLLEIAASLDRFPDLLFFLLL